MNRIKLDHWFIKDNELSISLLRYCANIKILFNDEFFFYQLKIIDDRRYEVLFNFYTLEDAISFVEDVVLKSETCNEIVDNYKRIFWENGFKKKIK